MKVTLINKNRMEELYKEHGLFAVTCYDTPDKYAEKVGKNCNESGHMSGSRTEYFKFRLEGIDRGIAEQFMRHEIGVRYDNIDKYASYDNLEVLIDLNPADKVNNMQSFRYVDKNKFEYAIPKNIEKSERAVEKYNWLMETIDNTRKEIKEILVAEGVEPKQAVEDANYTLPRATTLTLTIGFTPEALIHFMHKRLCVRSQDFAVKFARLMKKEVESILPEFAKNLQPHCEYLLWCPEGKMCCGRKPTKEKLIEILKANGKNIDWMGDKNYDNK